MEQHRVLQILQIGPTAVTIAAFPQGDPKHLIGFDVRGFDADPFDGI